MVLEGERGRGRAISFSLKNSNDGVMGREGEGERI
jgi:hypothetical protein